MLAGHSRMLVLRWLERTRAALSCIIISSDTWELAAAVMRHWALASVSRGRNLSLRNKCTPLCSFTQLSPCSRGARVLSAATAERTKPQPQPQPQIQIQRTASCVVP